MLDGVLIGIGLLFVYDEWHNPSRCAIPSVHRVYGHQPFEAKGVVGSIGRLK